MNITQARQIKIAAVILGLILIGFGIERLVTLKNNPANSPASNSAPAVNTADFVHDGNLIKNNAGLKPDAWYLSYEETGKPGLSAELKLNNQNADLQPGMRVHVEGTETSGVVAVNKLQILNAYKSNLIWLDTPLPNQTVISPITLHGWAKSSWYFEATFPIKLLDANGKLIAQTAAQAQGDWTTGNYVEFLASLNYSKPSTSTGTLVLEKDNPSGLAKNADELRVPVIFGTEGRSVKLYYYNPDKDKDASGNILVSRQGLVAVDRQIPITNTPIQDAIKLLLKGELTAAEKAQGITTEYPLAGLELKSADLKNNILTLEFSDPQNKTSGGSARASLLWFQIEATAKQFPGVSQVRFMPETLFQP